MLSIVDIVIISTSSTSLNPTSAPISSSEIPSESVYPSVDTAAQLGMSGGEVGITVAVVVIICFAAVVLAALLAYGIYRKVTKRKSKASF